MSGPDQAAARGRLEHLEYWRMLASSASTVVLVLRAHRIQVTLRKNQVVLLCIYSVNDPAHMVKTFGHTHTICALRTKTTVVLLDLLLLVSTMDLLQVPSYP